MTSEGEPPPAGWYKSSFSNGCATCVEARFNPDRTVSVRDSKYRGRPEHQPMITIPVEVWAELLRSIRGGLPATALGAIEATASVDGGAVLRSVSTGVELFYNSAEWDAFLAGAELGEFAVTY